MPSMTRISTALVLVTATSVAQAGPGCMTGGKHPMGGYPQHTMSMPGHGGYGHLPRYGSGYGGYGHMPRYGYGAPGMAMMRPHYSPVPAMASAGQAGYTANPAAAPAAGEGYGGNKTPEASADNITVRISGMRFEPSTITVQPGTTVTWIHEDGAPHTVTGENGALQSGTLTGGQRFSHTFEEGGSFDYACNFHPMMKGRVVVEESSS